MWITVLLGITFLGFQAYEYIHAYTELNLKLSSGAYGSTFFMLTGFHGFHVFVGMLMLLFITMRLMKGHFTPERHFGFEGAAWYWHFVDVVWLGLYIARLLALARRSRSIAKRREAPLCGSSPAPQLAERNAGRVDPAERPGDEDADEQQHRQRRRGPRARASCRRSSACRRGRRAA